MKKEADYEIAVVGAGIAGITTAYYLSVKYQFKSLVLIDRQQPMSFTSAQSGDNYRNWWPHPTMTAFSNHSIDLMEELSQKTSNVFNMTRRGYALATRSPDINPLLDELVTGYGSASGIRVHKKRSEYGYKAPTSDSWETAPDGVDILSNADVIRQTFPSFDQAIRHVVHIRRAGDVDSQQLAQFMLEQIKDVGGKRLRAEVCGIESGNGYKLTLQGLDSLKAVSADVVVNAAGPFVGQLAATMGVALPVQNVFQQKVALEDHKSLVPRDLPFSIDLDKKQLDWTEEENNWLAEEPELAWLSKPIAGGTHCRPVGGANGRWIKLGWAYNHQTSPPRLDFNEEPLFDRQFPEIVLRAAVQLQPALKPYLQEMPFRRSHYGGYYTMTPENWPLIGPLDQNAAFVVGALSGFGSMTACAAGELCARHIAGKPLPGYADHLSLARYKIKSLISELVQAENKGIL